MSNTWYRNVIEGVKLHPTTMCILKMFSTLKTYCFVASVDINNKFLTSVHVANVYIYYLYIIMCVVIVKNLHLF